MKIARKPSSLPALIWKTSDRPVRYVAILGHCAELTSLQSDQVRIAWQYQKYFKDEQSQLMKAAGGINRSKLWSHSFDLSRTMRDADLEKVTTYPIDLRTAALQKSNANNKVKLNEVASKCQELYMELNRIVNKFNT